MGADGAIEDAAIEDAAIDAASVLDGVGAAAKQREHTRGDCADAQKDAQRLWR